MNIPDIYIWNMIQRARTRSRDPKMFPLLDIVFCILEKLWVTEGASMRRQSAVVNEVLTLRLSRKKHVTSHRFSSERR